MSLTVYKRGKIYHYRGTVAGRRLRGSTQTGDKTTAERIAAEIETRAWKGHLDGPGATLTFAEAVILNSLLIGTNLTQNASEDQTGSTGTKLRRTK